MFGSREEEKDEIRESSESESDSESRPDDVVIEEGKVEDDHFSQKKKEPCSKYQAQEDSKEDINIDELLEELKITDEVAQFEKNTRDEKL